MSAPRAVAVAALLSFAALPGGAQTRWLQVETEHFLFIYEPRDGPAVDELLTFVEDVYAKVTGFFQSRPPKVTCILRGRTDDANGETFGYPARIDLQLFAPTDHFLGARSESWLKLLLTHELTHFVHQSMQTGLLSAASRVFGADIATDALFFLPGWAVEGPAVYDETVFSRGGRGRNPLFEVFTKAAAEEGSLFSLDQASYASLLPPAGRIYVAGYALVDWLQSTYGPDTLRKIMAKYLDFPFFGPWAAISAVTGKDASVIFADMRQHMVARYAAYASIRAGAQVTPDRVGSWSHPQPTARGLYLYRTTPGAFPAIVRWDPAARAEHVLVNAFLTDASSFSATSDGFQVWFSTEREDDSRPSETRLTADLFLLDARKGSVRQVTRDAHLWHPAVSSDGSRLLAVQGWGSYSRLVSVDPSTGKMRVLFSRAGSSVFTPAVSPDGALVAFTFNMRGFQDVCTARLDELDAGSVPLDDPRSPLTDVNAAAARPVLGPDPDGDYFPTFTDATTLLFCSDRSGELALYQADLATGDVSLILRDPVAATEGAVEDGSLLYVSSTIKGTCIKSVPLDELAPQPVDSSPSGLTYPAPEAPPADGSAPSAARPYIDVPLPLVWYPRLILAPTGPGLADIAAGAGAVVLGGSLLGTTSWSLDAGWYPAAGQPDGGLALSTSIGPVTLGVDARASYSWTGDWTQDVEGSASLSWYAFNESLRDVTSSLLLSTGVRLASRLDSAAPFTFSDALAAPRASWFSSVSIPVGVDYEWSVIGGRVDFVRPWALSAVLTATTGLPALSVPWLQGEADLSLGVNVPSLVPHQVIQLGVKAAQDFSTGTPGSAGTGVFADAFTLPRGFPAERTRAVPGGMLASVDYHVSLGLADIPLFLGWGLTGAGLGAHVEGLADFDARAGSLSVLPVIYAGVDLTFRLSLSSLALPLGIGLATAISTTAPGSFDLARDLGVYVFAGYDSRTAAAAQRSGVVQSMLTPIFAARASISASEW